MKKLCLLFSLSLLLVGCGHDDLLSGDADPAAPAPQAVEEAPAQEPLDVAAMVEELGETEPAEYVAYSEELFEEALGSRAFVLFFYAEWCPTCRRWEAMVEQNLGMMPNGLVLKADFDTELGLREEYGVTKQSTALFFDAAGNVVKKAMDPSADELGIHFLK